MNVFTLIPTLFTILGSLPKVIAAVQFLIKAIHDAETTGLSGQDKLTLVLNDFEVFLLAAAPTWAGEFETIAKDVEAVVADIVGLYNDFAHAAPAPATIAPQLVTLSTATMVTPPATVGTSTPPATVGTSTPPAGGIV